VEKVVRPTWITWLHRPWRPLPTSLGIRLKGSLVTFRVKYLLPLCQSSLLMTPVPASARARMIQLTLKLWEASRYFLEGGVRYGQNPVKPSASRDCKACV
jgi:hypothetical protein